MDGHSGENISQNWERGLNSQGNSSMTPENSHKHTREEILVPDDEKSKGSANSPPAKRTYVQSEPPMDVDPEKNMQYGGVNCPPT